MNPDIYFYNPTCELAVANGSENYMAKSLLRKMEYDLDFLPAFLSGSEDITLVKKYPDEYFLNSLAEAGFGPFNLMLAAESLKDPLFISKPKGFLRPWGWSPSMHKLFAPLKPSCDPEFLNSPAAQWRPVHKELYSRREGRELLKRMLGQNTDWTTSLADLPRVCTSHEQIQELQQKWKTVFIKAPWSSSGRGLQVLRPGEYNRSNRQVIEGILSHQGYVMVEPKYNKLLDISFQFYSGGNGKVDINGVCSFMTDASGRYSGSYLEEFPADLEPSLRDFIDEHLEITKNLIFNHLNGSRYALEYEGWLGIDAMVYLTEGGQFKIQPCLEVNCRYTMGAIVLALRKRLAKDSSGTFKIVHQKGGLLPDFFTKMKKESPIVIEEGKIIRGFLPLTPACGDTLFGAYLNVIS